MDFRSANHWLVESRTQSILFIQLLCKLAASNIVSVFEPNKTSWPISIGKTLIKISINNCDYGNLCEILPANNPEYKYNAPLNTILQSKCKQNTVEQLAEHCTHLQAKL